MTQRVLGPTGSPRRRWTMLVPLTLALVLGLFFIAGAQAVHDDGLFELDKNASNNTNVSAVGYLASNVTAGATSLDVCETGPTAPNGSTILIRAERMTVTTNAAGNWGGNCAVKRTYTVVRGQGGTTATAQIGGGNKEEAKVSLVVSQIKPGPDWDQVFEEISDDADSTCSDLGLVECSYVFDDVGPTTFTQGGSKDHLPISGWRHTSGNSADKAEILNAYAAKGIVDKPGEDDDGNQVLYFGMDRYGVDGSTDVGFWFFQKPVIACPDPDAGSACDGVADGSFAGEHTDGDILILGTFTQGGATSDIRVFTWDGDPETGTTTGPTGAYGDCSAAGTGDEGCATVNNTTIEVPWTYQFKNQAVSNWVPLGGFFEGGVDLTAAGLEGCFSSFLAETRSSPELTAILMDFALGSFEACTTSVETTPVDDEGEAVTEIILGDSIQDHALVTGIGGTDPPTGTMSFYICSPSDLEDQDTCETGGTPVNAEDSAPADGPVTLSPITGTNMSEATSSEFTPDAIGTWCWRGEYSGDDQYPAGEDASEGECFTVTDVSSIVTDQTWIPNDSATITTQGDSNVSGTVTFTLYDNGTCDGDVLYQEDVILEDVASPAPAETSNGDGDGDGLETDVVFVEADSPVTVSWKAVFDSDTDSLDSEGPCESSSLTIDDNDPEE